VFGAGRHLCAGRTARVIDEIGADVVGVAEVVGQADADGVPSGARYLLARSFVGLMSGLPPSTVPATISAIFCSVAGRS
jgi:hypothetical protein